MATKKEIQDLKKGCELFGVMVELDQAKTLIEHHVHDLKIEISSSNKSLKSISKKMKKGGELYKKQYGVDINLSKSLWKK